jgi:hypothetical protein
MLRPVEVGSCEVMAVQKHPTQRTADDANGYRDEFFTKSATILGIEVTRRIKWRQVNPRLCAAETGGHPLCDTLF